MVTIAIGITCMIIYFLPSLIAGSRNTVNYTAVIIINLFLWWTIMFWVIALIMAYWKTKKEIEIQEAIYNNLIK